LTWMASTGIAGGADLLWPQRAKAFDPV